MRKVLSIAPACLLVASAAAAQQSPPPVVTFDTAWTIIRNTHFDTTFNGINWNDVRTELRPRAEAAKSVEELRAVLIQMVARLGQSHFSLFPAEYAEKGDLSGGEGDVGVDVRYIDGKFVITRVEPGSPAARAGVKTGWALNRVDTMTAAKMLKRAQNSRARYPLRAIAGVVGQSVMRGQPGSTVSVEFLNERDQSVEKTITRRADPGEPVKLGNLPPFYTRFASQTLTADNTPVGLLWFNVWMVPVMARLDSAVDRLRQSAGIVIDLRGNPGGAGAMSVGVAGHFVDTMQTFGTMKTRSGTMYFKVNPRRSTTAGERVAPFAGPVAVLMDELSGSTSEVFAGGLQSIGRVRVFGSTSMGAVLPARADRLPNGDVLYHAIADFKTADGTLLEGRGVIPDEQVAITRADLLAGRDPVLDAALRWIAAQARTRKTTSEMKE
jgi:carboxyl-terminal processing protease